MVSLLVSHNAARRKRTERELREANAEIEQRVKERTAELEHANAALHDSQQERQKVIPELSAVCYPLKVLPHSAKI